MSEPMKVQTIGDFAELSFKIPLKRLDKVQAAIESVLALIDDEVRGRKKNNSQLSRSYFPSSMPATP